MKAKIKMNLNLNPISISQEMKFKSQMLERFMNTYIPPDIFDHAHDLKRAFVFGKNQYIGSLTINTLQSGIFARSVTRQIDPDYLILGNFNNYNLAQWTKIKPQLVIDSSDLFCKDELATYLSIAQNDTVHPGIFDQHERLFFEIDHRYRQIWTNDYMTAGLNSLDYDETKVLYGLPSSIITIQDLMLRFQLRQLEDIYSESMKELRSIYGEQVLYNPKLINVWLTEIVAQKFKNVLHSKSMLYTASVFRNCAMLGKSNLLLCNKHFSTQIRHFVQTSNLKTSEIYRGYINNQQDQNRQLYQKTMKQSTKQELLQKFYIISQLVDDSSLRLLQSGHNVLRQSIFAKKFGRTTAKNLVEQMNLRSKKIKQMQLDFQADLISNNIQYTLQEPSKKLLLSEQINIQQQRKIDFPVQYQVNSIESDTQQQYQMFKLESIMQDYLKSQRRFADHKLFLQYKNKQYSKQNIILYTKLIGELKIKTGSKVKLPLHHFKQFSGYYKQVMRDMILEKQYGIQKVLPEQTVQVIQRRQDISYQRIQRIMENRQLKSEGDTKQMRIQVEGNMDWDQIDEKNSTK